VAATLSKRRRVSAVFWIISDDSMMPFVESAKRALRIVSVRPLASLRADFRCERVRNISMNKRSRERLPRRLELLFTRTAESKSTVSRVVKIELQAKHCLRRQVWLVRSTLRELVVLVFEPQYIQTMTTY